MDFKTAVFQKSVWPDDNIFQRAKAILIMCGNKIILSLNNICPIAAEIWRLHTKNKSKNQKLIFNIASLFVAKWFYIEIEIL